MLGKVDINILLIHMVDKERLVHMFCADKVISINQQNTNISLLIVEALKQAKLEFKDLGVIAVITGPGSYTQLRVAVSTVNAFKIGVPNIPSIGVSMFEVYMVNFLHNHTSYKNKNCLVVIDDNKGGIFYQQFKGCNSIKKPNVLTLSDLQSYINNQEVYILGNAIKKLKDLIIKHQINDSLVEYLEEYNTIDSNSFKYAVLSKLDQGVDRSNLNPIKVCYIKPPKITVKNDQKIEGIIEKQ